MSTPTDPMAAGPTPGDGYGTPAGRLAGFWIRFAGALIDAVILGVVGAIIAAVLGTGNLAGRQGLSLLLGAIYFTYLHGSTGQSLGQKVCSIKVVDEAGVGQIDYVRAFIRWLVSLVSGFALLIGYLWMLWDGKNQTWHDKAARSVVVQV